ncbi:MAG TPA: hypothetical protein VGJ25_16235 [Gaiellaceae bacterium]
MIHYDVGPWQALALVALGWLGWTAIFKAIWDGLRWVAEKAAIVAVAVARAVAQAARYTWDGLKWFGGKVVDGAYWLRDRAIGLARWWKDKAAPWLARSLDKIGSWFKRHFGWLWTWVHRIQSILGWIYSNILRPLFAFLEVTRLVLRLLAALGVKWAARLETWIRGLEQKLLNVFSSIVNVVNSIADLLDALFDPTGAFKRKYFVWSLIHWWGDVQALSLLAGIDRNPWPEQLKLAEGPDPLDLVRKGHQLETELSSAPAWALEARRNLESLIV